MMMPSVNDNFFNGFMKPFDDLFDFTNSFFDRNKMSMVKTDIKEAEGGYELDMELPGYKKDEIHAKLDHGYLTIQAEKNEENESNEDNFIRRERYHGSVSRSFYVGENVKQEDINAKFDQGVLHLTIPKFEIPAKETGYISIEG